MRRNVLAGLVACGLVASGPSATFGAVSEPARTTIQSTEPSAVDQPTEAGDWLWDGMRGPMTMPTAPRWLGSGSSGSGAPGDVHWPDGA